MQTIVQLNRFQPEELAKLTEALSNNDISFRWMTNEDLFDIKWFTVGILPHGLIFCSVDNYLKFRETSKLFNNLSRSFWNECIFDREFVNKLLSNSQVPCVNSSGQLVNSISLLDWTNREAVCFTNKPTKTAFTGGQEITTALIKRIMIPGELQESKYWVAPKQNIIDEARFFVVNHEVVSGCLYRHNGEFDTSSILAPGPIALNRAKKVASTLKEVAPENYVIDVARLENEKDWRFLETNALPCSAFYNCDYQHIIKKFKKLNNR